MQDFLESPRFDTEISLNSAGGPGYKTFVFTGDAGVEGATKFYPVARARYNVSENLRDAGDLAVIRAMFHACRGKAVGFRFKDWQDFSFTDEFLGHGDGVNRVFPLVKRYGEGTPHEYARRLFKPVAGTVTVKVNGVTSVDLTINTTTGVVTFTPGFAPALDAPVTASGQFDVPVRFDSDELMASYETFDMATASVSLVEIKLQD